MDDFDYYDSERVCGNCIHSWCDEECTLDGNEIYPYTEGCINHQFIDE